MRLAKWPRTKSKKETLNTFEPYKWKGNTQYVDIKKKIVEILSQLKNGHWTKLLARHFLDIREMIYKQLLFVWHRSVFRTVDINLSQAFPSLVQYKSSNPKIQQAAHISDRVHKRDVLFKHTTACCSQHKLMLYPLNCNISHMIHLWHHGATDIYTRKRGDES